MAKLPGLEKLSIFHGKVTAHYEPVLLSKKQLEAAIRGAGFQISEAHANASAPLTDALIKDKRPPENSA
jgi:hypothetical protein